VAGDEFATLVDGASNPAWIGGRQVRKLSFRGARMVLTSPRRPTGELCSFVYEREGSA
jgi:hypothetical protein